MCNNHARNGLKIRRIFSIVPQLAKYEPTVCDHVRKCHITSQVNVTVVIVNWLRSYGYRTANLNIFGSLKVGKNGDEDLECDGDCKTR